MHKEHLKLKEKRANKKKERYFFNHLQMYLSNLTNLINSK